MKKRSIKALRRELDKVFSIYIRQRDGHLDSATGEYVGNCVTCGKFSVLEASHFIARQHVSVRWDSRNAAGACSYCNRWLHGNLVPYTLWMQKTYGPEVVDELLQAKRQTVKLDREYLENRLAYFKSKLP